MKSMKLGKPRIKMKDIDVFKGQKVFFKKHDINHVLWCLPDIQQLKRASTPGSLYRECDLGKAR